MKKAFVALLLLALTSMSMVAQIPSGYYDDATGKTGTQLRQALHDIIDDHTTISYGQIWNAFWSTDNKGNNVVWDMYSDGADYTYSYQNGSDQCGNFSKEGDCYNREHSWPKSWFSGGEDGVPGRDLHHIFPTDGYVNQGRSNYPYGEVAGSGSGVTTYQNGSKLGLCKSDVGYSGKVFEPIDEYKGDFARAYFYMSTRYYREDSDWGSSGMTTKANLKDWAVTMLLRWSDADPVSQKEIDRNEVVYGIQGNRNPFIDHPEYAHMIWDPNWSGMPYAITCATGLSNGSISAPSQAVGGTIVTLTATPAQGYMLGSWNVYKTGDANTTVPVSANGTFTMPSFNVTVSATFTQNNTAYNITCVTGLAHGSISTSVGSALSGTAINLSSTPASGYVLYSYYVYKTGDVNTIVYSGTGNSFVMPAYDVTVSASFVQPSSYNYVKVTSAPTDWSGDYVLVYENSATSAYVWTGVDAANCYTEKIITDNSIADDGMVSITIAPVTGGYSIKVNGGTNNGKYIKGTSGSNALGFDTNPALNTLSCESDGVKITSNTSVMRYNNTTNNNRFRYFKSDTYTNQQPIQLYKKTGTATAPTHTIQFNPNGASGTNYTQTVNEFEPTALQANDFTYEGYAFDSWNTEANGSGTTYFDGATVSLLNDLTLYAQWNPLFSVNCATVQHGSIEASHSTAVEGTLVTLTATPDAGYDFDYWVVTANNEPVEVEGDQFVMPASNVDVSAVFSYVGQTYTQKYYLVTDQSQLKEGRTYLIVNTTNNKAMGAQNGNYRSPVIVQIDNDAIATLGGACEVTLGVSGNYWTLYDSTYNNNAGGYLYAASSTDNQLKTQSNLDNNSKWSIAIDNTGVATIVAQGTNSHKYLKYAKGSNIFSCYTSGQGSDVYLFIRSENYDINENTTLAKLFDFDYCTIHSGATLTVSGAITSSAPNHIVIEDGGQLIHHNDGVKATVKKNITAYNTDGGWYTIAVPFGADYDPSGIATDNYDLYAYDEDGDSQGKEWINYKSGNFNLASGQGYLYAHNPTTTLRMTGTLNSGNYSKTIDLSYNNSNPNLKGFNLLGNPTAHGINFTKTGSVSDGYYYLNNSNGWVYETGNSVPMGRGFLVKANTTGQSVSLNPQTKGYREEKGQYLCLSVGDEKAYVKLNEGVSMPLLDLRGQHSSLYLMHEHKPYIMLVRDEAKTLDLCYEAHDHGTQTLTVDTKGLDMDYLHLIDHKTGADVDLLALRQAQESACYTFEASKDDYATRFMLAFAPTNGLSTDSGAFAYYADGEIRLIIEAQDFASLQVIDMMGRIIRCGDGVHTVSTSGMTPGVYVLRLITDDNVRVQKIVVK